MGSSAYNFAHPRKPIPCLLGACGIWNVFYRDFYKSRQKRGYWGHSAPLSRLASALRLRRGEGDFVAYYGGGYGDDSVVDYAFENGGWHCRLRGFDLLQAGRPFPLLWH